MRNRWLGELVGLVWESGYAEGLAVGRAELGVSAPRGAYGEVLESHGPLLDSVLRVPGMPESIRVTGLGESMGVESGGLLLGSVTRHGHRSCGVPGCPTCRS